MVDENPGGFLGVVDVANEFDCFLVTANIPELRLSEKKKKKHR